MEDKLMYIPTDDKHDYLYCISKLLVQKFETDIELMDQDLKYPKFLRQ